MIHGDIKLSFSLNSKKKKRRRTKENTQCINLSKYGEIYLCISPKTYIWEQTLARNFDRNTVAVVENILWIQVINLKFKLNKLRRDANVT